MQPNPNRLAIKATVITAGGSRVRLQMVCASRRVADDTIDALYPDARAAFITIQRPVAIAGVRPC